jgi:hypothetical protein
MKSRDRETETQNDNWYPSRRAARKRSFGVEPRKPKSELKPKLEGGFFDVVEDDGVPYLIPKRR